MFRITIKYEEKGRTSGVFIVNPDYYRIISGESLVEIISKFMLEIVQLQHNIHQDEIADLKNINDDIPF